MDSAVKQPFFNFILSFLLLLRMAGWYIRKFNMGSNMTNIQQIKGDQRVYNQHYQSTSAVSGSNAPLKSVLKCIYIAANFVFLHVQKLFWISAKLTLFPSFTLCN